MLGGASGGGVQGKFPIGAGQYARAAVAEAKRDKRRTYPERAVPFHSPGPQPSSSPSRKQELGLFSLTSAPLSVPLWCPDGVCLRPFWTGRRCARPAGFPACTPPGQGPWLGFSPKKCFFVRKLVGSQQPSALNLSTGEACSKNNVREYWTSRHNDYNVFCSYSRACESLMPVGLTTGFVVDFSYIYKPPSLNAPLSFHVFSRCGVVVASHIYPDMINL